MPYVVTEPCIKCKYTNCAAVCPVDAFREGPNFLVIDPNECIDCDACVSECPVEAIYPDDEVPEKWEHFIDLNERLAETWEDNVINETKDALPEADEWASKRVKKINFKKSGKAYCLGSWCIAYSARTMLALDSFFEENVLLLWGS